MRHIPLPPDIGIKVERAEELLQELDLRCRAFSAETPMTLVPERGESPPRTPGADIWGVRAKLTRPVPPSIRAIAGDVINNLRSSLEYLARALVEAAGNQPSDTGRKTQFPISDRADSSAIDIAGGVSADALRIVQDVQPGPSGIASRHPLALIRDLSNEDKHRAPAILVGGISVPSAFVIRTSGPDPVGVISPLARWLRDGEWAVKPAFPLPVGSPVEVHSTIETILTLDGDGPLMPPLQADLDYLLRFIRDDLMPRFEGSFAAPWPTDIFRAQPVEDPMINLTARAIDGSAILASVNHLADTFPASRDGEQRFLVVGPAEYVNVDPRFVN